MQKVDSTEPRPYRLQKLALGNLDALRGFFDGLPPDPYLAERYRSRRFSKFRVESENLWLMNHEVFVQAKEYNPLLGEVRREFMELDEGLTTRDEFKALILDFLKLCQIWPRKAEVGVHQIQITSSAQKLGYPAPEGLHQDGFDFIGIFCVSRDNINGGETALYEARNTEPIYRRVLEPGELLVIDDRLLLHYTSPIEASEHAGGARNVFILAASVVQPANEDRETEGPSASQASSLTEATLTVRRPVAGR